MTADGGLTILFIDCRRDPYQGSDVFPWNTIEPQVSFIF